jgi:hypothetical protein
MSSRLTDTPARVDTSPAPSPKHPFNRDPLLIPRLFVDGKAPAYQRVEMMARIAIGAVLAIVAVASVSVYTLEGLLRRFALLIPR